MKISKLITYRTTNIIFRRLSKNILIKNYARKYGNDDYRFSQNYLFSEQSINTNFSPNQKEQIISDAEKIILGNFCIFETTFFEGKIIPDWSKDYFSGKTYESVLISNENNRIGFDKRAVWELNRLQFLPIIGLAYSFTKDDKYFSYFNNIIKDWDKKNQPEISVNWGNAMECSLRLVNIIITSLMMIERIDQTPEFRKLLTDLFVKNALFIYGNLEVTISGIKSNHYLSDLLGLFVFGLMFNKSTFGKKMLDFSFAEFEREIINQTHSDGVNFEHSIPYHRYSVELFLYAFLFAEKNNLKFSDTFRERLKLLLIFVDRYIRPDGTAPIIGDNDNGRVFILTNYFDTKSNDHLYLLDFAKILFDLNCSNVTNKRYNEICLFFSLEEYDNINNCNHSLSSTFYSPGSKILFYKKEGTFFNILGWDVGTKGIGNHQHNDLMSFELGFDYENLIVDPGCYNYTGYPELRQLFRSSQYHNSIVVDSIESNGISQEKLFKMNQESDCNILFFKENITGFDIEMERKQKVNKDFSSILSHKRSANLNINNNCLRIEDKVIFKGSHTFNLYLHFNINTSIAKLNNHIIRLNLNNKQFEIEFEDSGLEIDILNGWVSDSYYKKYNSRFLNVQKDFLNLYSFKYKIYKII